MVSFDDLVLLDGVPIYQQILRHVKLGIAGGTIAPGDALPSRRVVSALLGVNPNTVQKAYRLLEEEGLIQSHPGAKSCVAADEAAQARVRAELLQEQAQQAEKIFAAACPGAEVSLLPGGQPVYYYMISAE